MIQIDMKMPTVCADCCFATADLVNGIITLFCMTPEGRKMYAPDLISRKDRPEWCPMKEQEAVTVHDPGAYCPKCGWMLYPEDHPKFCGNCGRLVKWNER